MLPSHFPGGGESESSVFRASSTSSLTSQLGSQRNRPKPKIWSTNGSKKRKTSTSSSQSSSSAELVNSRENEDKHGKYNNEKCIIIEQDMCLISTTVYIEIKQCLEMNFCY